MRIVVVSCKKNDELNHSVEAIVNFLFAVNFGYSWTKDC